MSERNTREPPARTSLRELIRVGGLLRRLAEPHFARVGLSGAQWGVLRALARLERRGRGRPRMHELGAALLVQPPSLSATLDRMARARLIVRRVDPRDRRTRLVGLAPAGRSLLEGALDSHHEWMARAMGGLSRAEQARLTTLLVKLGRHMQGLAEGAQGARRRHR